jgi:DNA-binding NtrC family response regulator/signal transduction histidine kinase
MGERIRAFDWASTPLGPIAGWPQSLRTAVSLCLKSRSPHTIIWGPQFVFLYNDALIPIMGNKHPGSLGRPAPECYAEIWPLVGPMLDSVRSTGRATWSEDTLVVVDRKGYLEETYATFSYVPILLESGAVGGTFEVTVPTTERVIGERRLRTLRDLASRVVGAQRIEEVCRMTADVLAANPYDIPFAQVYLLEGDRKRARLAATAGIEAGTPASPGTVDLTGTEGPPSGWPLARTASTGEPERVDALGERFGALPRGAWDVPPQSALLLPLSLPGQQRPLGILVAAVSPRKALDAQYQTFFDLVAAQISASLADVLAHEAERRRAEALAEIDRAKTAFFSNVSHEFRTPLTLLLGPLEDILKREGAALAPGDLGALEMAHRNGLRLQKLVDSLLDFSRIEAGRVQAVYEPTDLAALTADLAGVFRSAVERAGLRLVVDCPPLAEPVYVDRGMWEKIVFNLVSNAFNHTFEGEVRVTLRQAGGAVELSVGDTGTGIPEEELPRVFERFHRVEGARGRTQEGTGIGLALVQELVKLHGGSAGVESALGKGSVFTVAVPRGKDHLPADRAGAVPTRPSRVAGARTFPGEALHWLPDETRGSPAEKVPPARKGVTRPEQNAQKEAEGAKPRILLADDNADMRGYLRGLLSGGYEVTAVEDGAAALAAVRRQMPDLVLCDVMMPRLDGFGLLKEIRCDPAASALPVILLTARAGEESKVEGLGRGADDYLVKPFSARELTARVAATLALARLRKEAAERQALAAALAAAQRIKDQLQADNIYLQGEIKLKYGDGEVVGQSAAIQEVLVQVEQVAATAATVLLLGETGTGKELLARAIHRRSPRHARLMVTLNCAALPATLVESELFGREKGAYTGALTQQAGRFELADSSTLFLDEVGELPLEMQAKLLRVLQEGRFERLGGAKTLKVDVRVVAASNRDLAKAVKEGRFRDDLYYRLNVFPIRLPPLRERREDIPALVWAFVKELAPAMGKAVESVPRATLEALQQYDWPGNIRELRNVIERALIVCPGPVLRVELPPPASPAAGEPAEGLTLDAAQRRHILAVLEKTGWRVSGPHGAAALLGLKPTTLESRMAKLGIRRSQ